MQSGFRQLMGERESVGIQHPGNLSTCRAEKGDSGTRWDKAGHVLRSIGARTTHVAG